MTVYCLDPLVDNRWPSFVRAHARASVFHTRGWLEALRRTYRYVPVAFTTSRPGDDLANAIAGCEVRSWLTGRRFVSMPFADHCEPLADDAANRQAIVDHLAHEVRRRQWRAVELRPLVAECEGAGADPLAFCFHSLDLRPSLEQQFERFHKDSIQRKIRRAEREGIRIESAATETQLRQFYALLLMTRRRHHVPPQPIAWFRNLIECLGADLTIDVALQDARPVAAIVLLRHGETLVYKYGASDARVHNLGAMPFLFWNAMQRAKIAGQATLDLGRTDLENPGLITFKDRLGAERSPLRYFRYPPRVASRARMGWPASMAKQVVAYMPDRLLVATGRLVYRHFG